MNLLNLILTYFFNLGIFLIIYLQISSPLILFPDFIMLIIRMWTNLFLSFILLNFKNESFSPNTVFLSSKRVLDIIISAQFFIFEWDVFFYYSAYLFSFLFQQSYFYTTYFQLVLFYNHFFSLAFPISLLLSLSTVVWIFKISISFTCIYSASTRKIALYISFFFNSCDLYFCFSSLFFIFYWEYLFLWLMMWAWGM